MYRSRVTRKRNKGGSLETSRGDLSGIPWHRSAGILTEKGSLRFLSLAGPASAESGFKARGKRDKGGES